VLELDFGYYLRLKQLFPTQARHLRVFAEFPDETQKNRDGFGHSPKPL
jgi:hypothetical protein